MRQTKLFGGFVFVVALGCSSPEGAAQVENPGPSRRLDDEDKAANSASQTRATSRPSSSTKSPEDDTPAPRFRLRVTDRHDGSQPFTLVEGALFAPEVSLFGGGNAEPLREITLRRGAAEIQIPAERVRRIQVIQDANGRVAADRLQVTITVRNESGNGERRLEGTVRSNLELRGSYEDSGLQTVVHLRDVDTAEFN